MIWKLVVVFILTGEPVELISTAQFETEQACHAEMHKFVGVVLNAEWVAVCVKFLEA